MPRSASCLFSPRAVSCAGQSRADAGHVRSAAQGRQRGCVARVVRSAGLTASDGAAVANAACIGDVQCPIR
eukprot:356861-Chlamydomonas_euryale.AAC.12